MYTIHNSGVKFSTIFGDHHHAEAVQILLDFHSGVISISVSKPKSYLGVKKVFNNKIFTLLLIFYAIQRPVKLTVTVFDLCGNMSEARPHEAKTVAGQLELFVRATL